MGSNDFGKEEIPEDDLLVDEKNDRIPNALAIDISGSRSSSGSGSCYSSDLNDATLFDNKLAKRKLNGAEETSQYKKPKPEDLGIVMPLRVFQSLSPQFQPFAGAFVKGEALESLPQALPAPQRLAENVGNNGNGLTQPSRGCKQFWKAGDYEGSNDDSSASCSVGMDHVRVHPKFLHSNATSHKWALGAFAELLDNSLDEVDNGANYVHIDMLKNKKDGSKMLLVEDNGGGMTPDKMRQCMSLGYSAKCKQANTIGQYGNGFKTSTMRLGADVIVFSRCPGNNGRRPTQSIGMLSYSFLRGTGKEDIVVPIIDYETRHQGWNKIMRTSMVDWCRNLATIVQWSPYSSEEDLLQQFNGMKKHGTRIIIYNLWEDDEGQLELDFDADPHDIQIRGVNRDEKNIKMAKQYPNSRHFLTYRHSLRSYASILYLRLPPQFRIFLRGKDVEHHNTVNDMMITKEMTYRPQVSEGMPNDLNTQMVANVTIGFVKDAHAHIDVQGFNVYHKNRLIKPFWRVWNAAGSDGRGVIGVLEANFVEPAHDKQGFERTIGLSRLEARLVWMQKNYWSSNCQRVGYAARRRPVNSLDTKSLANKEKAMQTNNNSTKSNKKFIKRPSPPENTSPVDGSSEEASRSSMEPKQDTSSEERSYEMTRKSSQVASSNGDRQDFADCCGKNPIKVNEEKCSSRKRSTENGHPMTVGLLDDLNRERERCRSLEIKLREVEKKMGELDKEQTTLLDILEEERTQRQKEEERLNYCLVDAYKTINELREKVRQLEHRNVSSCKAEK